MAITKRKLRKIIRQVLNEGTMKRYYGEIQNAILACGQELGGEMTVDDCIPHVVEAAPFLNRPGSEYDSMYEEVLEIMWQMVEDGMLTDGYEDFFSVHPDYM